MADEQPQRKIVKSISPAKCPHCKKDLFTVFEMSPAYLIGVIRPDDLKEAKDTLKIKLDEVEFVSDGEKEMILAWIDDPNNLIDKTDVEPMLQSIIKDQDTKKNDTTKDKT